VLRPDVESLIQAVQEHEEDRGILADKLEEVRDHRAAAVRNPKIPLQVALTGEYPEVPTLNDPRGDLLPVLCPACWAMAVIRSIPVRAVHRGGKLVGFRGRRRPETEAARDYHCGGKYQKQFRGVPTNGLFVWTGKCGQYVEATADPEAQAENPFEFDDPAINPMA